MKFRVLTENMDANVGDQLIENKNAGNTHF